LNELFLKLSSIFLLFLLYSCAPTRIVRPLKAGEDRWGISAGGPVIKYNDNVIPTPLATVTYAKGLNDSTTFFMGINATSLLFTNIQTEFGFCYNIYKKNKLKMFKDTVEFGISVNPVANVAFHLNGNLEPATNAYTLGNSGKPLITGVKLWPQLDANCYWNYGKKRRNTLYFGINNWFEVNRKYSYNENENAPFVIVSPQLGNILTSKSGIWSFTTEIKYLAPYLSNQNLPIEYVKPGKTGAIGFFIGVSKRIIRIEYDDD
jgi:hypothetical protein